MAVHLDRPPHNVRLVAWGRADDGWWACICWRQRVRGRDTGEEMDIAAWVPGGSVRRPGWSSSVDLPRLELPSDRRLWPAPAGWPSWYAGVWLDGAVSAPPGVELVTGAAWRERRRRGSSF
jgi:hypothetical protein